jgi:hypothetical protein
LAVLAATWKVVKCAAMALVAPAPGTVQRVAERYPLQHPRGVVGASRTGKKKSINGVAVFHLVCILLLYVKVLVNYVNTATSSPGTAREHYVACAVR